MAKSNQQRKSGGSRKIGRNKVKCAAYRTRKGGSGTKAGKNKNKR